MLGIHRLTGPSALEVDLENKHSHELEEPSFEEFLKVELIPERGNALVW